MPECALCRERIDGEPVDVSHILAVRGQEYACVGCAEMLEEDEIDGCDGAHAVSVGGLSDIGILLLGSELI